MPAVKRGRSRKANPPAIPKDDLPTGTTNADAPQRDVGGGEGRAIDAAIPIGPAPDLAATIEDLRHRQRTRRFAMKSQMRQNNATLALVRSVIGWSPDNTEAQNKRINDRARLIVSTVEAREAAAQERRKRAELVAEGKRPNGREPVDPKPLNDQDEEVAQAFGIVIRTAWSSRQPWDDLRFETEKQMEWLAQTLPVWEWVEGVRGFGAKGLAVIVGEAGDLSVYDDPAKLWTRLGVGLRNGRRQGDPGPRATKQDWVDHAYSGRRRSESWNICQSLIRGQWRGAKEDPETGELTEGHPLGRYGALYASRKTYRLERNEAGAYADAAAEAAEKIRKSGKTPPKENLEGRLTRKHIDNQARRDVEKRLLKHLWQAWRRQEVGSDEPPSMT
jgi:hypothetical protein